MNDVKLSICIATRNRASFISVTLQSIICQSVQEMEIVIIDGASTDNTEEVVRRHKESFTRLRYFRKEENMGVDQDFAEAVDMARGEYCWLFSDDDIMKPGAIRTVLDAIKGKHGLIIANAEVRNADLSEVLDPHRLSLEADRLYRSDQDHLLLADAGDYLTFIGSVIIRHELWDSRDKKEYFGSCFVHVGVIFQSPLPEGTLVIADPLISIRYGNASWLSRYFEVWMFKWPNLIWSFPDHPESAKRQVCAKEPWRKLRTLLLHRAKGTYTIRGYREWLEPRLESSWSRAASKAIAYLPGRVANFLAFIYYSTFVVLSRRAGHLIVLVDLRNSPFYFLKLSKGKFV